MRLCKGMASKVVIEKFNNIHNFSIDLEKINKINNILVKEYINDIMVLNLINKDINAFENKSSYR